jgi:hypothetical protein
MRRVQRGAVRSPPLLDHPTRDRCYRAAPPAPSPGGRGPESARPPARSALAHSDSWACPRPTARPPWGGRRLIGRMCVRISRPADPHTASRSAGRCPAAGKVPCIRREPGIHPTGRVLDVGRQHAAGPAPLNPVMVRAIERHPLTHRRLPRPPCPVRALPPCDMLDPTHGQPPPQGLITDRDPVALGPRLRPPTSAQHLPAAAPTASAPWP